MKPKLLFPLVYRYLGYALAIPGFILFYLWFYRNYELPGFTLKLRCKGVVRLENFTNELAFTLIIVGLLFIAFAKVKREDELTGRIRLNALYWGILINYILYILCASVAIILQINLINSAADVFFGFALYNLFTPLLLFICRFYYLLYRNRNEYAIKPVHYLPYKPFYFLGKWLSLIIISSFIICKIFSLAPRFCDLVGLSVPFMFLLWAFAKAEKEDEYMTTIRLEAMQIAIYINYAVFLISDLFVYGMDFLDVMVYNLSTIPLIFIIWFQYKRYCINKQLTKDNVS